MMIHRTLVLLIAAAHLSAGATEICESSRELVTPFGRYRATDCAVGGHRTRSYLSLDDKRILESEDLFRQDRNERRSVWVYQSGTRSPDTGCATHLHLVDIGNRPVKVFSFGVKKACNEFHWASWGDKRSVIALKHNVKFVYENGKLTPPAKGEALWKAIEPPHSGPGLSIEDAVPFVEDVPLPNSWSASQPR